MTRPMSSLMRSMRQLQPPVSQPLRINPRRELRPFFQELVRTRQGHYHNLITNLQPIPSPLPLHNQLLPEGSKWNWPLKSLRAIILLKLRPSLRRARRPEQGHPKQPLVHPQRAARGPQRTYSRPLTHGRHRPPGAPGARRRRQQKQPPHRQARHPHGRDRARSYSISSANRRARLTPTLRRSLRQLGRLSRKAQRLPMSRVCEAVAFTTEVVMSWVLVPRRVMTPMRRSYCCRTVEVVRRR